MPTVPVRLHYKTRRAKDLEVEHPGKCTNYVRHEGVLFEFWYSQDFGGLARRFHYKEFAPSHVTEIP